MFNCTPSEAIRQDMVLVKRIAEYRMLKTGAEIAKTQGMAELMKHEDMFKLVKEAREIQLEADDDTIWQGIVK